MKILVRLPNWLGDLVMSSGFLDALQRQFPEAVVDVIVKAEIAGLVPFLPNINAAFRFSKKQYRGVAGLYHFVKKRMPANYDLFFCLPDSFSSALMGFFVKSRHRIGYRDELRSLFLTHAYVKPADRHRVEEYVGLVERYLNKPIGSVHVGIAADPLPTMALPEGTKFVVNINSEAVSRRMPQQKASQVLQGLLAAFDGHILLTGSRTEQPHVDAVLRGLGESGRIHNYTGKTTLAELVELIHRSDLVLSTDSGLAHLANALHKPLVVLFGAGNERNTGPYNPQRLTILRVDGLPCAPCESNVCKVFGLPECLIRITEEEIVRAIADLMP
jgi:heptosyltransferase-2